MSLQGLTHDELGYSEPDLHSRKHAIWIDISHPKYAWVFRRLYDAYRNSVIVTVRDGLWTPEITRLLGYESFSVVGRYGTTLSEKLRCEAERVLELERFFSSFKPRALIGVESAAIRYAFGHNIPIVCVNDTPKNEKLVRLTVPLCTYLVTPECCAESFRKYLVCDVRVVAYDGVEERAYITPDLARMRSSRTRDDKVRVLVRDVEYLSSYASSSYGLNLVVELSKIGDDVEIVFVPRYDHEVSKYVNAFKDVKNVKVVTRPVLLPYVLASEIDVVVGSGGTICKESTLLGIPTISFHFWDEQMRYLNKLGLPNVYINNVHELVSYVKMLVKDVDKHSVDTTSVLDRMEDVVTTIRSVITSLL